MSRFFDPAVGTALAAIYAALGVATIVVWLLRRGRPDRGGGLRAGDER